MKHSQLQCDTRFMTANEEKFEKKKKSKQRKAVVKCMLRTEHQQCNHVHNEAMPHKLEGGG